MEQTKAKTVEITSDAIEKLFIFIKSIGSSIVYEDNYDYSKGIKGSEVDYTPETIEELASELELRIVSKSHIANLEAQNKELKSIIERASMALELYDSSKMGLLDDAKKMLIQSIKGESI